MPSPSHAALQQLFRLDRPSSNFHDQLNDEHMANCTSNGLPNLGNDPPESSPARVLSNRELRELRKKEKKAKELREKLEVHYHPRLFQRRTALIPSQIGEKQKELECENEEREARELKEKFEVVVTPISSGG